MRADSLLPSLPSGARILVIRLRSIGDIVLLTPALRLLKQWRPDLSLSVMVESPLHELLAGNPAIDELLDLGAGGGWSETVARVRAAREVRRRRFAVCLNLHGGPTSRWLTRLSGAEWKVGFHHFRATGAYDFLIPDALPILGRPSIHTAELQAFAFFWLGLPRADVPRAFLAVDPRHAAWWRERRVALGLHEGSDYAVIHPTALYPTKQWAPERFARLGDWLESEAGLPCLYSCGPGEGSALNAVERAAGSSIRQRLRRLEGAGLGQFAAVLAGARLFVGNDSGPAHMAAALGRPLVVIFGSSNSAIWGPWPPGLASARLVENAFDCKPCPGDRCYRFERPECILSVTLEQVREVVERVLQARAP